MTLHLLPRNLSWGGKILMEGGNEKMGRNFEDAEKKHFEMTMQAKPRFFKICYSGFSFSSTPSLIQPSVAKKRSCYSRGHGGCNTSPPWGSFDAPKPSCVRHCSSRGTLGCAASKLFFFLFLFLTCRYTASQVLASDPVWEKHTRQLKVCTHESVRLEMVQGNKKKKRKAMSASECGTASLHRRVYSCSRRVFENRQKASAGNERGKGEKKKSRCESDLSCLGKHPNNAREGEGGQMTIRIVAEMIACDKQPIKFEIGGIFQKCQRINNKAATN